MVKKDKWDKLTAVSVFLTALGTLIIALYSIPQFTQTINTTISQLRSCGTPYPISGHVTYNGKPVTSEIEITNIDLRETKQIKTNDLGEYIAETLNWGWPGGSTIKMKACYDVIGCKTKEFVMACTRGHEEIDFEL